LMREMEPSKEGAVPEGGLAGSEPAWGECPRSPKEEVGRGRPTYQEPPHGGTTNVADADEPLCETNPICAGEGPARRETGTWGAQPGQGAASGSREVATDCAKQTQSGAGQITANLLVYEGLHQERESVPSQKQSQIPEPVAAGAEDGSGS
ncbi:MAG: hypothetical protein NTZ17_06550, partial [Phycisphaerae bacterium]|nr:hypothetical protein [Phycisphaerae bacterium]